MSLAAWVTRRPEKSACPRDVSNTNKRRDRRIPHPAKRFASIINGLWMAVESRRLAGRLAVPLMLLIVTRFAQIRQAFYRIAGRLARGKISPRKSGGPRPGRRPGTPNRLPSTPRG